MAAFTYCPFCAKKLVPKKNEGGEARPTCPDGHYVHYDNPIPTVIGLVEHGGKYLILRRNIEPEKGKWDLPGGFIEAGEDPLEAFHREIREETGLTVEVTGILGAYPSSYGGEEKKIVGIVFHAEAETDEVRLSAENDAYEWRAPDDIPELAFRDSNAAIAALLLKKGS